MKWHLPCFVFAMMVVWIPVMAALNSAGCEYTASIGSGFGCIAAIIYIRLHEKFGWPIL